jgi:hypothetical protein
MARGAWRCSSTLPFELVVGRSRLQPLKILIFQLKIFNKSIIGGAGDPLERDWAIFVHPN